MNERPILGLIIVATAFTGIILGIAPVFGFVGESFLTIERSTVSIDHSNDNELMVELDVEGLRIPTNETQMTFGYGVITEDVNNDAPILVTHMHPGIHDSEEQRFIDDPTWHNHFVRLGDLEYCRDDQGVVDITWQSPGEVEIRDHIAIISDVPTDEFEGWHSITGEPLLMSLSEAVSEVVSFKIDPVFGNDNSLEAICLTDIRSSEEEVSRN